MILKTSRMGVSSRIRYRFFDPDTGERVPAINTKTGAEVWGGEWHNNMITDTGLDAFAQATTQNMRHYLSLLAGIPEIKESSDGVQASQSGTTVTADGNAFEGNDVGRTIVWADGSSARITAVLTPTTAEVDLAQSVPGQVFEIWHTDISMVTPLAYGGSGGLEDRENTYDDDYWITNRFLWRQVELSENMNLNAVSMGDDNSGTRANVIELIRDASGNPITVSLLAGKAVRVDHMLTIRFPRAPKRVDVHIDEYDAGNQFVGRTTLEADLWHKPSSFSDTALERMWPVVLPSSMNISTGSGNGGSRLLAQTQYVPGETGSSYGVAYAPPTSSSMSYERAPYTPGTRRRVGTLTAAAAYANGPVHGVLFRNQATGSAEDLVIQFADNEFFTKESTHTLAFGYELSWDRDYAVG